MQVQATGWLSRVDRRHEMRRDEDVNKEIGHRLKSVSFIVKRF